MKSRLLAGFLAVVLALVGGLLVFAYAGNANDRAMAEMEPANVLVVASQVPAGTAVEALGEYVQTTSLPSTAIAASAIRDLSGFEGKVTAVDLVPGEQLLAERMVAPEDLTGGTIEVPKGLQEVSFQLEPQKVVGGRLVPGDHVGIFISFDGGALEDAPEEQTTQLVLRKVLVTAVQRAPEVVSESAEEAAQALPQGSLLLTVAVDDLQAQKIVFAAEFAKLWLSKEPSDAKESKSEVVQKTKVYR
ncbi:Flp pilus assembly protein CpaB [Arthrobacter crystallopoietes]|uniref:Flp pilus assembly protein CpaB n=1 Tax=Crystallibacter crystallopoietes TaxID=37928 RepID=UPI001ABE5E91|nr:Flp pilus assembly protein CpaB [Arthrobacter crystallopoietes]QTG80818.1 Flp pilus assembly protein CpaB [Arthrobacter crystallopoietes]